MKFKKSFISLVVMTAVVSSSCLNAMKRVGGQAANESAQAMKKRGSKIVKGSASAIQSGVSNLADQYYQAAKAGVSSTWDWVAKKDKEAEQELAKI